jgi:2-methylcitrate dehydratase PrpD
MRLPSRGFLDALGSAGTQAAGLWEFNADGTMSKHLHPGKAAFNGLLAADLAAAGFTGASRILEGERGFLRAMSTSFDVGPITDRLGSHWKIAENCYKLHSCCGHTHSAIDAALEIAASGGWSPADLLQGVTSITIDTYGPGYDIVKQMNPCTPYQAKFSLAYCVAAALLERRVGLEQFSADRFGPSGVVDQAARTLLARTHVAVDPAFTAKYPAAWPGRVALTLRDGRTVVAEHDYPRGNPENPVSTEALEEKFLALVSPRMGRGTAERAVEAVRRIEQCDDLSTVFRHLGCIPTNEGQLTAGRVASATASRGA